MDPATQAGFFAVGLVVGFVAGLVGIGGGVLMVPFLYFVYESTALGARWAVRPDDLAAVAHATSLFVIVPTAVLGVLAYRKDGVIAWRAAVPIGVFSLIGGVVGARVALLLPGDMLKLAFGVFLIATALQLVRPKPGGANRPLRLSLAVTVPVGLLVGMFSAILGVGGGLIAIPLLLYVIGIGVDRVAATSLAIIMFAATAGTITYMLSGSAAAVLPAGSIGYVHALPALPLMAGAALTVRSGARMNRRMSTTALRWLFAIVLLVLGARLIVQSLPALL